MLVKNDKIKLVKPMGMFTNVGEVCDIIDVNESGVITFKFGNGMHMGCMSADEFDKYFVKYEEPENENDSIEDIMANSEYVVYKAFDKCTIVACKLPNGFVTVEYSACVNPEDYDEEIGVDACLERIYGKIAEMEAYKRHYDIANHEKCNGDCNDDCHSCHCYGDEEGECLDCEIAKHCNDYLDCVGCPCPYLDEECEED